MRISETTVCNILTRTSGYLQDVASHSVQPYRGCTFGHALCGVGCYVRHNPFITRGRQWGDFLEIRTNADDSYRSHFRREQQWAQARRKTGFTIFFSSSTEPFLPQEFRYGVSKRLLEAMIELPPDRLILQTHSAHVTRYLGLFQKLASRTELRVHLSIETDLERIEGLPAPATSVADRLQAARTLRSSGIRTVVTISPLLPMGDPESFFRCLTECADAVVIDHFIGGDGSPDGARTRKTHLPAAMERLHPGSASLDYRDRIVSVARRFFPGKVGLSREGFAGHFS